MAIRCFGCKSVPTFVTCIFRSLTRKSLPWLSPSSICRCCRTLLSPYIVKITFCQQQLHFICSNFNVSSSWMLLDYHCFRCLSYDVWRHLITSVHPVLI